MKRLTRLVVLLLVSLIVLSCFSALQRVRADTYNQIPLWINIIEGATINRDQIDDIEKQMDQIFANAGLNWRVTSVIVNDDYKDPDKSQDQPGEVRVGAEEDGLFNKGKNEVKDKAGVKIFVVKKILNSTGGSSGFVGGSEIVPGTRTIDVVSNKSDGSPVDGQTWAHELGHVLGLQHENPDGSDRPPGDLMYPFAAGGTNLTAADVATMNQTKIERALGLPSLTNDQIGTNYDEYHSEDNDTQGDSWYNWTDIWDAYFSFYILNTTRDMYLTTLLGGLVPEGSGLVSYVALDGDNDPATGGEFQDSLGIDYLIEVNVLVPGSTEGMLFHYPGMEPIAPLETKLETCYHHRCSEGPPEIPEEPIQNKIVIELPLALLGPMSDPINAAISVQSFDGLGQDMFRNITVKTSPPTRPTLTLDPPIAYSGTVISASGTGYTPDSKVSIIFNHMNMSTAEIDPDGSFTTSFTVPYVPATHYMVDAIDDSYNVGVSMFTITPDTTPPLVVGMQPENKTYYQTLIPLVFSVNEPLYWIGYSLDTLSNVTIAGNTTITVEYGQHQIVIYANDTSGNMGFSEIINFTATIPGDINGDFQVSLVDLVLLANAYGSTPGTPKWNPNADIDGNGVVGLTDLVLMALHYGQHYP
jgi:hypothetical protein